MDPFIKWMVTGDEKWDTYDNIVKKQSWSKSDEVAQTVPKPGPTTGKLDHLKLAINQKRPELVKRRGVVFHQNNGRPLTYSLETLGVWLISFKASTI
ncbi:histone-lysine N-methyltransferase SETMAR [Trichonephila clavipes]|nr:histone-lysine N-methyltransferase SETMAR [Trichonephila clavipes]